MDIFKYQKRRTDDNVDFWLEISYWLFCTIVVVLLSPPDWILKSVEEWYYGTLMGLILATLWLIMDVYVVYLRKLGKVLRALRR